MKISFRIVVRSIYNIEINLLKNRKIFSCMDSYDKLPDAEIKPVGEEMKRNFFIASHKKRTMPRAYETFLDYIQKATKQFS